MVGAVGVQLPSRHEVTAVLSEALPPGVGVSQVVVGNLAGWGLVGNVQRVVLEFDGPAPGVPRLYVLKTPAETISEGPVLAEVEREFYASDLADSSGLNVPRAYVGDGWLLLEDLGDEGFIKQAQGYEPEQALAAVREIAGLHACFRAVPVPHWLRPPADSAVASFCRTRLQAWNGGWPSVLKQVPPLLVDRFDDIAALLHTSDSTVAHGDFHSQNIHVTSEGCRVVDFQFLQHASGLLDIARLLATSLTTEVRRDTETTLLDAYHARLSELGQAPEADWQTSLRAGLLWNFATPLTLHVRTMSATGKPWPERLPILERALTAVEDWAALDLVA